MNSLDQFRQSAGEALRDVLLKSAQYSNISYREPDLGAWRMQLEQIQAAAVELVEQELEALSMDAVQPCEPDCDDVRHALHTGSWNAHLVIEARLEAIRQSQRKQVEEDKDAE